MLQITPKHVIQLIEKLVYIALICVGCFFIYQGDVLQRFQLKRTNFAEYEENLTEFPTILTWPAFGNLKFGEDYNISFRAPGLPQINLTEGYQTLGKLSVHFESGMIINLSPVDLSNGMVPDYKIVYLFENASTQDIVKEVNVRLSAKNNTW